MENEATKREKTIVVLNRRTNAFHTSKGMLMPNESVELPEEEGKKLLEYTGMVDAAKYVPQSKLDADLRAANDKLTAENEQLKKELSKRK